MMFYLMAYIDDIFIYSPDYSSHVHHVNQALAWLAENQLYVKGEKCFFHVPETSFLEYVTGRGGVAAVTEWTTPDTVKHLQ